MLYINKTFAFSTLPSRKTQSIQMIAQNIFEFMKKVVIKP